MISDKYQQWELVGDPQGPDEFEEEFPHLAKQVLKNAADQD